MIIDKNYFQATGHNTNTLHTFILVMFEKYAKLLESQFSRRFEDVCATSLRDYFLPSHHHFRSLGSMITFL